MRRHLLGVISLGLLLGGLLLLDTSGGGGQASALSAAFIRAGTMCLAMWLAWPQVGELVTRTPRWVGLVLLALAAVIVVRPKLLLLTIPVLIGLVLLQWLGSRLRPRPRA